PGFRTADAAPVWDGGERMYGTTANWFYRTSTTNENTYELLAPLEGGPAGPLLKGSDGRWYGMTATTIVRLMPDPVPSAIDFDGDAAADLPLYEHATGTWRLLTSSSDYHSSQQIFWGGAGSTPVPADYDGDGRLDVAGYHAATAAWHIPTP